MKCKDCGHEYPSSLPRCRKCGRITPKRSHSSTLIEFPRQPRVQVETPLPPQPAWRAELTEKVRAIQARRSAEASHGKGKARAGAQGRDDALSSPASSNDNPVLAAALSRLRRASENAAKAPPAQISLPSQSVLSGDREATARAFAPAVEEAETESESKARPNPYAKPQVAHAVSRSEVRSVPVEEPSTHNPPLHESNDLLPAALDEIDPLDYLAAEVKKVDQALGRELARDERAPIVSHLIAGVTDSLTIAAGCLPFIGIIAISRPASLKPAALFAIGLIAVTVAFFYLTLTQYLCGKTFGMMLTNTRVVDATSLKSATGRQALLRAIGYFVALLPFGAGFLWLLVDRRRRGLHDYLSGTVVMPDY